MECFHVGWKDDNFIKVAITDFSSEGDSYFGGAYFKGECELGCTGFKVKTTSFYFDNNAIYHFYKDLQKHIQLDLEQYILNQNQMSYL